MKDILLEGREEMIAADSIFALTRFDAGVFDEFDHRWSWSQDPVIIASVAVERELKMAICDEMNDDFDEVENLPIQAYVAKCDLDDGRKKQVRDFLKTYFTDEINTFDQLVQFADDFNAVANQFECSRSLCVFSNLLDVMQFAAVEDPYCDYSIGEFLEQEFDMYLD